MSHEKKKDIEKCSRDPNGVSKRLPWSNEVRVKTEVMT